MLRGQASLQEIIGRPQTWRRNSKPKLKDIVPEESPARLQESRENTVPPTGNGKRRRGPAVQQKPFLAHEAAEKGLESPFASQEEQQQTPVATPSCQGNHSPPRRSPRTKARSLGTAGLSENGKSISCPVCSKELPLNDTEINRHIGAGLSVITIL